jgi:hypothetical protein
MAAMPTYTLVENLFAELDIPKKGFTSRPVHNDDKAVPVIGYRSRHRR